MHCDKQLLGLVGEDAGRSHPGYEDQIGWLLRILFHPLKRGIPGAEQTQVELGHVRLVIRLSLFPWDLDVDFTAGRRVEARPFDVNRHQPVLLVS